MGNEVYANRMELACKAGQGKSICAFPDVCFTPPQTPATPPGVPLPYPNTGMAGDTSDGSKTVQIGGQEVMLKDKSNLKKSAGNEAGMAPKKGIVTSTSHSAGAPSGSKAYFNAWSMDVKFESENVVRHLDLTTHNHASKPGNGPPWPFTDAMSINQQAACQNDRKKEQDACNKHTKTKKLKSGKTRVDNKATAKAQCKDKACQQARKCMLTPYKPDRCCAGQSGHHLVEVHSFCHPGKPRGRPLDEFPKYNQNDAPAVCAACRKGSRYDKEHGRLHAYQGTAELDAMSNAKDPKEAWKYKNARQAGVEAHAHTFPKSDCNPECIKAQLDAYHKKQAGVKENDSVRTETPPMQDSQVKAGRDAVDAMRSAGGGGASVGGP